MKPYPARGGVPRNGVRISGGSLKGRMIPVPPGIIRPAMEKMRESVFAVLGDLSGASFLDLFSGSLIIALEAASRGASRIEAVEADRQKRTILIANSAVSPVHIRCRFLPVELFVKRAGKAPAPEGGAARLQPAAGAPQQPSADGTQPPVDDAADRAGARTGSSRAFDYIFCDPPFNYHYKNELIANIAASSLMHMGSILMIHHPKKDVLFNENNLALKETHLYGNSAVDFFYKDTRFNASF